MRPRIHFRLSSIGLMVMLVAACARNTPLPSPGVTVLPTDSATPTLAPSPTPPPTPREAIEKYLSAWQAGDYGTMYGLLSQESQSALTAAEFEQRYRSNLITMTVTAITPTVTNLTEAAETAQAQAHLAYSTVIVGMLETDVTIPLKRTAAGGWGVVFSPAIIWPDLVDGNQLYMVPFPASRGRIFDRNGLPLAQEAAVYSVGVVPNEILPEDVGALLTELARLTGLDTASLDLRYQLAVPDQYLPLSEAPADIVENRFSHLFDWSGVYLYAYTSRYYYGNGDAAPITGYVSPLQPDELEAQLARGYSREQLLGRSGLEKWGEEALAGKNGGQLVLLDAQGNPLRTLSDPVPSVDGQDIYATIDFDLQQAVQFALGDMAGAVVALNRDTGEVLALASNPNYDPNWFNPNNYNRIALDQYFTDPRQPLINRAAQAGFPAGSVFKIVTLAAGLTSKLFTPDSEYECTGTWEELPPALPDWLEDGHGRLTLTEGLSGSCNPWFWHVGYALFQFDPKYESEVARQFGLGQATGIGAIEETEGLIPDPDWKLQTKGEAWEPGDSLNLAIGQGDVLVTPLQIARLAAAVGNGGTLHQPQLVLSIQPADGQPTFTFTPIEAGRLPLDETQLAALQEGMYNVTQEPRGTARNRFRGLPRWLKIAGKTGTAEDPGLFGTQKPNAWFTGYTIADVEGKPNIAIAVVVTNQGQGSDFAAPIFRRVVESYYGLPLSRYSWESSVGVVVTPTPTVEPGSETPTP